MKKELIKKEIFEIFIAFLIPSFFYIIGWFKFFQAGCTLYCVLKISDWIGGKV